MGYFLTAEPENAAPANSLASPKTHVPFPPVKERGRRFYSPEVGRWLSRDPIGEKAWKQLSMPAMRIKGSPKGAGERDLYSFVRNAPVSAVDFLGLMGTPPHTPPAPPTPPPSSDPCDEAQKALGIPSNYHGGETVCHNGKVIGCVWNKGWTVYKQYPGLLKCAQLHEDTHVAQDSGINCPPCGTQHLPYKDEKDEYKNECPPYQAELDCLKTEHKTDCGTDYDPDQLPSNMSPCEAQYWNTIKPFENYIRKHCQKPSGGP